MIESFELKTLEEPANLKAIEQVKELDYNQKALFAYNAIKASALAHLLKTPNKGYGATYNKIYDAVSERPGRSVLLDGTKLFDTLYILNNDKLGEFLKQFVK